MGTDIHTFIEIHHPDGYWTVGDNGDIDARFQLSDHSTWCHGFEVRNYDVFAFLGGVRNYANITPISEPRGIPNDASDEVTEASAWIDAHNHSWLTAAELSAYDYTQQVYDEREGRLIALGKLLGRNFLAAVRELGDYGEPDDVRIVFWFDS